MTLFEHAGNYHFDALENYILKGGDINICNDNGFSLLYMFIVGYLCHGDKPSENEKAFCEAHSDSDYNFWDSYVYECCCTPLEQRKSGIYRQLEFLFAHGANPNLCEWKKNKRETPLMAAVCNQDYFLTKYLLEHGADPGLWLFKPQNSENMQSEKEYWLMDEMDIAIMNGSKGEQASIILSIAQLLWKYGLNGNWSGYCIDIDPNQGVIGGHTIKTLY